MPCRDLKNFRGLRLLQHINRWRCLSCSTAKRWGTLRLSPYKGHDTKRTKLFAKKLTSCVLPAGCLGDPARYIQYEI